MLALIGMNSWKSQHCLPVTPNCLHCLIQTVHYYCSYLPWFNNKSLKVLILFYMNSAKVVLVLVLVGSNSSECVCIIWYELWKKCLLLFYSKLLKVSVWFDMNSEKVFTVVFTHVFSSFFFAWFPNYCNPLQLCIRFPNQKSYCNYSRNTV